jgi:pimeloyl-ACP methyl ester carboxylesterase
VVGLLAGGLAVAAGCAELRPPTAEELNRGYVLLLPGVESEGVYLAPMIAGLRDGGVTQAVDMDMWGMRPMGTMLNLTDYEANRKEAGRLASKIVTYRNEHPSAPITIVGYSGGGGMALFTAEALPQDFVIDRVVLLAAAISPRYDLGKTMAHCRQGIVSFYSENDWSIVGVGTELFGTMDRQRTASAGYIGFRNNNDQLLTRGGLEQIAWTPAWRNLGHGGDHGGYLARAWAREMLAPQLRLSSTAASRPAGK